jgi:hypothetical protein
MVFSPSAPVGRARVVGCSHALRRPQDLITEAVKLWEAESLEERTGRIAASRGCVALLCNPHRKIPANILDEWATRVDCEPGYGNISHTPEEGRFIN